MTVYPRLRMRLRLAEQDITTSWSPRTIESSDARALGALMLAAYRGTVDDEGETKADAIAEVERTLAGEYGPFLGDCSFAIEDEGRVLGASMVSLWEGSPFFTYVVVHPDVQRRGLGTLLTASSGNALVRAGYSEVDLLVTEANEPAVNLYRKLGFEPIERVTEPT